MDNRISFATLTLVAALLGMPCLVPSSILGQTFFLSDFDDKIGL